MSPLNGMSQRRWSFSYNLSGCDSVALWGKSVVFCYIGIIHPRRKSLVEFIVCFLLLLSFCLCGKEGHNGTPCVAILGSIERNCLD